MKIIRFVLGTSLLYFTLSVLAHDNVFVFFTLVFHVPIAVPFHWDLDSSRKPLKPPFLLAFDEIVTLVRRKREKNVYFRYSEIIDPRLIDRSDFYR